MWTSGKLVVKKKKQAATLRKKAWECQLTSMWHSPGWHSLKRLLICLDQTCSETQLDPKALIHQTDEYRGSHAKENWVDKPFFLLLRRFFQAWLHWVNHSLIVVRLKVKEPGESWLDFRNSLCLISGQKCISEAENMNILVNSNWN